ncbi:hypothetical protein FJU08_10610 [Martelella alba]|uniref:Uncharacterized protein n=1 Tax=Martelella alba TaxID=2590451 RepID=A0A506UE33_9HYPH|nr:hypothetical protein [Martelella alba]TPW31095.1 hypothetical protein FJU08_10610 [Martelella alba]
MMKLTASLALVSFVASDAFATEIASRNASLMPIENESSIVEMAAESPVADDAVVAFDADIID